ncbi:anaphase-promoting complex subunit 11 [Cryptococcus wingfieldii CBS 7118]|uniref:Anaphase-promoting complex subunit 11 n=1 Tax=Cryptococcus wingfieldii CBS 7118 TaxID=1295528 RepID=A0A1E3IM38_9TREE|nr:anaphase-promoting complex subunit 11 [Cryptococcus wingfieldii CBS 7118]ODN89664.1 anaphase-promoting complex subunit 11 [Cryptococcus wingfieldii CBS 7118]
MKLKIESYNAVAYWKWDVSTEPHKLYHAASADGGGIMDDDDDDEEVCGICQAPFESTCPDCKVPGDDCPLIWGECTHVFHMHCLLKWIGQKEDESQQQCPMDRRPWVTADQKPERPAANADQSTTTNESTHILNTIESDAEKEEQSLNKSIEEGIDNDSMDVE